MLKLAAAEFRKAFSLPSTLVAVGLSTLGTIGLAVLTANSRRVALDRGESFGDGSTTSLGLDLVGSSVIGVIVIGVFVMSSEYTPNSKDAGAGRQIVTSLISVPRRRSLLAAKTFVVAALTGVMAAVTILGAMLVFQLTLGEHGDSIGEVIDQLGWRIAGAISYWVLTALIALALTVVTRSGVIPLIVLIGNSSLISVSFLLTKVTPLAKYLPDAAGAQTFAGSYAAPDMLGPVAGGLVMATWTALLLVVAGWVFARRDA